MNTYNKLVRDKIPEIIRAEGRKAEVSIIADDEHFLEALGDKLIEEAKEFSESKKIEELADIVEIIYTILELKHLSLAFLEKIRKAKREARGAFTRRFFLHSTSP